MSSLVECENCGEEYPPRACGWRCPSCSLNGSKERKTKHKYEDDDE